MTYPVYIHAPQPSAVRIERLYCPVCDRKRRFVTSHVEWYGWRMTCLRCGDSWDEDGELAQRPFAPAWRRKSIRSAWSQYVRFFSVSHSAPSPESPFP